MTAKQKFDIGVDKINKNPWVMKVLVGTLCVLGFFGNRTLIQYDETNRDTLKELKELSKKIDHVILNDISQSSLMNNNERRIISLEMRATSTELEINRKHESMREWVEDWVYKNFQRKI